MGNNDIPLYTDTSLASLTALGNRYREANLQDVAVKGNFGQIILPTFRLGNSI